MPEGHVALRKRLHAERQQRVLRQRLGDNEQLLRQFRRGRLLAQRGRLYVDRPDGAYAVLLRLERKHWQHRLPERAAPLWTPVLAGRSRMLRGGVQQRRLPRAELGSIGVRPAASE